jgi:hypothetical protein
VEEKTELKKFSAFGWAITHETFKHDLRAKWRRARLKRRPGESHDAMSKRWWRLEALSRKRLVLKIVKMVESFELKGEK